MTCRREANIDIQAGFDEDVDILVTTPVLVDGDLVDTPLRIDGWMLRLELNKTSDPTFALVKSTVNGGIEILDQDEEETRGMARVHLLPLDTAQLSRSYEWRVRGWDPSGAVRLVQRRTARVT